MRYVAAFLLAVLGGKANPSAEDVQKILESIGIDVEEEKLQKVTFFFLDENNDRLLWHCRCTVPLGHFRTRREGCQPGH